MITTYLVKFRLKNRRYLYGEWDSVTVRATTEHSAADKFQEHVTRCRLFIHSFFINDNANVSRAEH